MSSTKNNLKSAMLFLAVACSVLQVTQAAEITVDSALWTFNGPQDTTAEVGDVITFSWAGNHNVLIHPSGDCDTTGAIPVGGTGDSAGAPYTFVETDIGEVVFACDVGTHCENQAMIMTVTVSAGATSAPAAAGATSAPTWTPTSAPADPPSAGVSSAASKIIAFVTLATAFFTLA
jgi:plastocyanin